MIKRHDAFESTTARADVARDGGGGSRYAARVVSLARHFHSCDAPRRWLSVFSLSLFLLLIIGLPAQAANYTFQAGSLPSGCSGGNGVFTCTSLTLGIGDTITVSSPTTIAIAGAFTMGASSRINAVGTSSLTLLVTGVIDLGADTVVRANLSSIAGVITIGDRSSFTGSLKTDSAAINVGANSTVTGPITTTVAGVVTIGAGTVVNGSISTNAGAVTTGAGSLVTGTVLTQVGAITIGGKVGGKINSSGTSLAGAVTVNSGGVISGFITTGAGAVTLGSNSSAAGVSTDDGAITIGASSRVGGSLCTGNSGAITVGADSTISGNVISKTAGAITIGTLAQVAGAVTVMNAGALTIAAGAVVGTLANNSQCPTFTAVVTPPAALPPTIKSREWRQIFMR